MLKIADKAPAWSGADQDGVERSSDAYRGKWMLLYFYPKDDTPGCTTEACGLRDHFGKLQHRIAIVGVSADSIASHEKFAKKYRLPFTLIADPSRQIIKAYGADGMIMSKRISFLIRPDGTIAKIYPSVDCAKHAAEISKDLDEFTA
jgi:peroxiredoxin Q/BCP